MSSRTLLAAYLTWLGIGLIVGSLYPTATVLWVGLATWAVGAALSVADWRARARAKRRDGGQ